MRFNWLAALCVLAIAIMMLDLHPVERTVRAFAGAPAASQSVKDALVAENSGRHTRNDLRRER
jgi:hypothetical protein